MRIGTKYEWGAQQVEHGDRHEMGHNAGLNHENPGDIMGAFVIHGGEARFGPGDLFDLYFSGNGSPLNPGGPGSYVFPDQTAA